MVFTTRKELPEILDALGEGRSWVLVGCAECAATCQTGGSAQVEETARELEERGRKVLATVSLASPCDRRLARRDLRRVEAELREADGVLCLSCGGGVQVVADVTGRPVVAGLDAHFVATVERLGLFHEECRLCGRCLLNETGGVCPEALCPKGVRNGPCEGSREGRCDVDPGAECVWERIHRRLAEQGRAEAFGLPHDAPSGARWGRPRSTARSGGGR